MDLTTIPGVELCQMGSWDASTGPVTFTGQDLHDAVAAQDDPGWRTPQVYLGHDRAALWDGAPSVGTVVNLRVSDDGITLLGDLELIAQIAELAPTMWPDRSIEGLINARSTTGSKYGFVLTGLALLGATTPALELLAPLPLAASAAGTPFALSTGGPTMPIPATLEGDPIAAAVNVENVRRAWWDLTDRPLAGYAWIRAIFAGTEQYLIVETDDVDPATGAYVWRVDWAETDGIVTFGEPQPVREAFVPADEISADDAAALSSPGTECLARFVPTEQLLRDGDNPALSTAAPANPTTTEVTMSDTAPVAEDATVAAAAAADGTVVQIDASQLAELRAGIAAGQAAAAELARIRHDGILASAVAAGKVAPASRDKFAALLAKNEAETIELIDSLAVTAPVVELGAATNPDASAIDAEYAEIFGKTKEV